MKKLVTEINTILQENLIIYPTQNLLCTVSSGQDSIFLFFVFLHLKNQWNLNLGLVYCHHFWQKTNFFSFRQIWKIAFLFDLPCFIPLTERKLSTENQARNWRQKSLERVTLLQNSSEIALGHTGSDKLETALWNLIRGSSPNGLNSNQKMTLSKRTFVQNFFSVNSTTCFKPRKKEFKIKKQFFYRINSKKKSFGLWSPPIRLFQFLDKRGLVTKKISSFYFGLLINIFSIELEKAENLGELLILKKEKKCLIFYISRNLIFFSFCFKKRSFGRVFKKIRPLSTLHREDILKFSEHYFLPVIPDPTNAFSNFSRSKIRNQVLPVIRYLFSSNFDLAFIQFLKILEIDYSNSDQSLKKIYKIFLKTLFFSTSETKIIIFSECSIDEKNPQQNKDLLKLSSFEKNIFLSLQLRYEFQKFPISIQSKILKKIFFYYSSSQLNYAQMETLRFLIRSKKSFKKRLLKKTENKVTKIKKLKFF